MSLPGVIEGPRRRQLARLLLNGVAQAGGTVLTGWLVQAAFQILIGGAGNSYGAMAMIGGGLLLMAGALAWLRVAERTDAERLGQHYVNQVRIALFDRLTAIPVRAVQRRSRGGLVLRFVGDLKALRQWVSLGLARVAVACLIAVLSLAALAFMNAVLALAAATVIVLGAVGAMSLGERARKAMKEARRRQANLATNVTEKIASIAVVQVFDQTRRERNRLERQGERLQDAMVAQARQGARLKSLADFVGAMASAAVLLAGALEVSRGAATAPQVVAAMTIVGLLVPALRDLGLAFGYWTGAQVVRQKLSEFMDAPALVSEPPGAPAIVAGTGRLEFRGVSLEGALERFSAVAEPGLVTAIVGPNGSGKSTLLSVAARLVDPDSGAVLLDGQNLAAHSLTSVRKALGVVSPDLPLLRGTVDRNLRYRWAKAPDEEIERVKASCRIDEILADLPEGMETRVLEGGANLSFGQRQRITMARAMLGSPPVLLLDEVDANLDPRSRTILDQILAQYRGTVLIVTHRLARAAKADAIWYVENGRLLEAGPPAVVLNSAGPTRSFFGHALEAAS